MCSHCMCESGRADRPRYWHLSIKICLKAQRQVCLLAAILTKAEACCLDNFCNPMCRNLWKNNVPAHMDSQMACNWWTITLWLVHFAERIGGKLATFTVVNLIASISYALITEALMLVNRPIALLQLCESPSWMTKISDRRSGADHQPSLPSVHCMTNDTRQSQNSARL